MAIVNTPTHATLREIMKLECRCATYPLPMEDKVYAMQTTCSDVLLPMRICRSHHNSYSFRKHNLSQGGSHSIPRIHYPRTLNLSFPMAALSTSIVKLSRNKLETLPTELALTPKVCRSKKISMSAT